MHAQLSWDLSRLFSQGKSFQILDKKRFEQDVLPVYFGKKSKYSSFTRKLHRWYVKKTLMYTNIIVTAPLGDAKCFKNAELHHSACPPIERRVLYQYSLLLRRPHQRTLISCDNLVSFHRQFTRITRGPELGAYFHPLFQRSNPHLTLEMTCNAGRSNQQNETMNPEVLGMATPQMIRYGFASASSEPPTQMKTNGSEGSFQLQMSEPDFNFAGQASAAAASQQLPSQVISRELEALLQQSLQPRDTRAGSEALTAPLTPALRGVVSSSSSSSNSNISGMISDHHRIMLLQLELQNLQRQLDHERNPQQSMIPLSSLLSGTTSFPAMQNSTINGQSVTSPDTDTAATSRNGIPTMMGQDFNYASMVPTLMASTGGASANLVVPSQIFSDSRGNDLSMPHLSNSGQATTLTKNLDVNTVGDNSVFRWPPTGVVVPVSHTAQHNSHGDLFDDVHPIPIAEIAANQRFPPTSGSHNPQHLLQQPVQGQEEPSELFGDDRAYYSLSYRDDTYD